MFGWICFGVDGCVGCFCCLGCSLLDCTLWVMRCFGFALGIMVFWVLIIVWAGCFCFTWVALCLLICVFVVDDCLFLYVVARLLIFFCFVVNFYYKVWLVGFWVVVRV